MFNSLFSIPCNAVLFTCLRPYDVDNSYYVYLLSLISKLSTIILCLLFFSGLPSFFSHSNCDFAENATNLDLFAECYTQREWDRVDKKCFIPKSITFQQTKKKQRTQNTKERTRDGKNGWKIRNWHVFTNHTICINWTSIL